MRVPPLKKQHTQNARYFNMPHMHPPPITHPHTHPRTDLRRRSLQPLRKGKHLDHLVITVILLCPPLPLFLLPPLTLSPLLLQLLTLLLLLLLLLLTLLLQTLLDLRHLSAFPHI
jgi:hypothetical protein